MNATLFQVGILLPDNSQCAKLYFQGHNVRNLGCLSSLTDSISFIEENHEYKVKSQMRQSQQVSQPGRPTQDMMSFWGKRSNALKSFQIPNVSKVTNSKRCAYCLIPGAIRLESILRIERMRLLIITLNTALL
jgi:hypothetical protein